MHIVYGSTCLRQYTVAAVHVPRNAGGCKRKNAKTQACKDKCKNAQTNNKRKKAKTNTICHPHLC